MSEAEALSSRSSLLFYQTEDGHQRIEVRLEQGTVWLSQMLMAELFQTTVANINLHIRNIYEDKEVSTEGTIKQYLIVRQEGSRKVQRPPNKEPHKWILLFVGMRAKPLVYLSLARFFKTRPYF